MIMLVLEYLYAQEINVRLESFFDGGWTVSIGDEMNGWAASASNFSSTKAAAQWLLAEAPRHFKMNETFETWLHRPNL